MNTLKQLIKDMAMEQIQLKKARKTGPYDLEAIRSPLYGHVYQEKAPENIVKAWRAADQVRRNATKITAALNLYATLRGKTPCHDWRDEYCYTKEYAELVRLYGDSPISSK